MLKTRNIKISNKIGKFLNSKRSIGNFNCDSINCNECPFNLHYVSCSELKRKDLIHLYSEYLKLPVEGGAENEK